MVWFPSGLILCKDRCALRLAQHTQHTHAGLVGKFGFRLGAPQKQVEQFVVWKTQQAVQASHFVIVQAGLVAIEKSRQNEVILEQAASGPPAQSPALSGVCLM
jgi:hypothetical protein